MYSRRHILSAAAALPLASLLASCGGAASSTTSAADYINALASGLKAVLSYVGLSSSTLARYQADIDKLAKLASDITANDQKSVITQAIAAAEDALSILSSINLPAKVKIYVAAADTVLAILQGMAGLFGAGRHVAMMSEAEAMAVMRGR